MILQRVSGRELLRLACFLYVIGLVFGSRIYFYVPAVSLMNVLLAPLFFSFLYHVATKKFSPSFLRTLLISVFYLILVVIYTVFYLGQEQIKDLVYSVHLVITLLVCTFLFSDKKPDSQRSVSNFFYYLLVAVFISAILQAVSLFGYFPQFWQNEGANGLELGLVTGPYANPNNLASVALLFFCFLNWMFDKLGDKKRQRIVAVITFFIIMITLSRLVFVLFFSYYFIYLWYKGHYRKLVINSIVTLFILSISLVAITNVKRISYAEYGKNFVTININRIIAIGDLFNATQNRSSDIRLSSYFYFFENIDKTVWGQGSQNYVSFYKDADFDTSLIEKYPHSYWVESSLAFGIFSPIIISILFLSLLIRGKESANDRYLLIMICYFCLLINIPSSVFRMPVIWLPLFAAFVSVTQQKNVKSIS